MGDIAVVLTYTEQEAKQVARALRYFDSNVSATYEDHDRMGLIVSAIERALPKPKPDEPTGLGAVVEDADGKQWVRIFAHGDCNDWREAEESRPGQREYTYRRYWREIDAVKVLSEGIS